MGSIEFIPRHFFVVGVVFWDNDPATPKGDLSHFLEKGRQKHIVALVKTCKLWLTPGNN